MIKKLYIMITSNVFWKLLSLAVAITLWFIVKSINDPITPDRISVPLQVLNKASLENKNYILQNELALNNQLITFRVRASASAITELKQSQSNLKAFIDLKALELSKDYIPGEKIELYVKYELPQNIDESLFKEISIFPQTVDVVLDEIVEKDFSITVDKIGDGKAGYVSLLAAVEPETVTLKGPKSKIDTIEAVHVSVDLREATKDVSITRELQIIDTNGDDITQYIELSAQAVKVNVPVDKYQKISIQPPVLAGNVAEGFRFDRADYEPKSVEVVGNEEEIKAMKSIELPAVNISNRVESFTTTVDLRPYFSNSNLAIRNGTPHEVKISVNISKEAVKEIQIPIESISIEGMSRSFLLPDGNVILVVKGQKSAVESLTVDDLSPYINLAGLDAGKHDVEVEFLLPSDVITVSNKPTISVEILEDVPTPTEFIEEEETIEDDEENQTELMRFRMYPHLR